MNGATRAIAKVIYGGLPSASYQEALDHFGKARRLRPDRLIHQIEYGRTLAKQGREADARTELAKGIAMPSRDKDDAKAKERGQKSLDNL
jgi:predicted Zn-dependent protease